MTDVHVIKKCMNCFKCMQAIFWHVRQSITGSWHAHKHSHERNSPMTMHNDQTTYQTIHFKHNNSITWAKAILAKIQTRCDQLTGTQAGLVIPVNFYVACTQSRSPTSKPAVLYPRKARYRLD